MADESDTEMKKRRKKHKKKHKKREVLNVVDPSNEEAIGSHALEVVNSPPMNNSPEIMKPRQEELAAKTKTPVPREWTFEQENRLLREVEQFASNSNGKGILYRVEWSKISLEGFSKAEIQKQYKKLTKKVRKIRTVQEIVSDALQLHKEGDRKSAHLKPTKKEEKGPAKPMNAFMLFCKAKRPSLVEKHPELSFAEIHKKMCERWKVLDESKRQKYVKKYEKAKLKYLEELEQFQEKQLSEIKKPLSAFDMWRLERAEEGLNDNETDEDFLVEWDSMPKSMKKGWIQAEANERERYESEVNSITKNKKKTKQYVKLMENDTSTSDELGGDKSQIIQVETSVHMHQSSPSKKAPSQKRKMDTSNKMEDDYPLKKVSKQHSSSSEEERGSSDEDD